MIHAGRYYEAHIVCKIDDGVYSGTLVPDNRGASSIVVHAGELSPAQKDPAPRIKGGAFPLELSLAGAIA